MARTAIQRALSKAEKLLGPDADVLEFDDRKVVGIRAADGRTSSTGHFTPCGEGRTWAQAFKTAAKACGAQSGRGR